MQPRGEGVSEPHKSDVTGENGAPLCATHVFFIDCSLIWRWSTGCGRRSARRTSDMMKNVPQANSSGGGSFEGE